MVPVVVNWNEREFIQSLSSCVDGLRESGYDIEILERNAEVRCPKNGIVIIESRASVKLPDVTNCQLIYIASNDSGSIFNPIRDQLSNITYVIKPSSVYRPASLHNQSTNLHLDILSGSNARTHLIQPNLLYKIITGPCSHICTPNMLSVRKMLPNMDGPFEYDVSFVGTARDDTIRNHRQRAVDAINALSDLNVYAEILDERMPRSQYLEIMRKSRITVSPWGFGEFCVRDYEAYMLGSMLVKPQSGFIYDWGNNYRDWETYFPCDWNFESLAKVINIILTRWDYFYDVRLANRRRLERYQTLDVQISAWKRLFDRTMTHAPRLSNTNLSSCR